jgi:hypothetical protein
MSEFRKKPVVVEAWKWPWPWHRGPDDVVIQMLDKDTDWTCEACGNRSSQHGNCKTLEGWHIVCPGDWIIRGIKGEYYPCKPDIFAATYEPVE